ncbi:MAG: SDR family oxidoreductase [Thermodesulfobacteriota bacterium]
MPCQPKPDKGVILVVGASGYIGGRLVPELSARGYRVRVMVRGAPATNQTLWPEAEVVIADAADLDQLRQALDGVDTAYYLIHSLHLCPKDKPSADLQNAENFRVMAEEKNVKRIIYLGGLGEIRNAYSPNLRNRQEVARTLRKGKVPVTVLRAGLIIGSGSAAYEITYELVRKLPVIFIPPWARQPLQPIGIRDVVKYLVGSLEVPETEGKDFEIGGPDILTFEQMLRILSEVLRAKTFFLPFFFSYLPLYTYPLSLLTPVPNAITRCLMEGLKKGMVVRDDSIRDLIPIDRVSFKETLIRAMTREEQDRVHTRWSDAYPPAHVLAIKLHELQNKVAYKARYELLTSRAAGDLFRSLCKIGGKEGWFHGNWMWRARGFLDRLLLGVGLVRGRKSPTQLEINDVVDFWRVEDIRPDERLLLRAEMKLPGRAWLEFVIGEEKGRRRLSVEAYYDTRTVWGRLYWYLFLPFHHFLFTNLLKEIEKRS